MIKDKKIILLDDIIVEKKTSNYLSSGIFFTSPLNTIGSSIVNDGKSDNTWFLIKKLENILKRFFKPKSIKLSSLKKFFEEAKSKTNVLNYKEIQEVLDNYEMLLKQSKNNGQVALVEKIEDYANVLKLELILSVSKFNKFLEETDIVNLYEKASKHETLNTHLHLTYIKNFIKIIPDEISKLKLEADQLNVFDNYVILHYDQKNSNVKETKEEIEKKKDPILFGVIRGSRRLYYIGDWIDDYCDLTLDVIIKTLNIQEKVLNKETITEKIGK